MRTLRLKAQDKLFSPPANLIEKVQKHKKGVSPIFGCMTTMNINELLYACHVKIEGRQSQFDGPT